MARRGVGGCLSSYGVANEEDECAFTPFGAPVTPSGRPVGDFNADCDVTLSDYRAFDNCIGHSGPGVAPTFDYCGPTYDADVDGDVDLKDFAGLQIAFTGS